MDESKYLYHYTNIETLALILKNRTIRFNSLDRMDDLQEQQTADVKILDNFAILVLGRMIQRKVFQCGICMLL